jgi:hypothetical protein
MGVGSSLWKTVVLKYWLFLKEAGYCHMGLVPGLTVLLLRRTSTQNDGYDSTGGL